MPGGISSRALPPPIPSLVRRGDRRTWKPFCAAAACLASSQSPVLTLLLLAAGIPAVAQDKGEKQPLISPEVVEVARTYDLAKKEEFLAVTLEITGPDPLQLRRIQPLRDDFQLVAGKASLPCRWLRGGSLPEDPRRLRFSLGFSMPPARVKIVDLKVNLPRLQGDDLLEFRLDRLQTGAVAQKRGGAGWGLTVTYFGPQPYVAPSLPPKGQFLKKTGAFDMRIFRKADGADGPPAEAILLTFQEGSASLFDPTLDVSGLLSVEGGGTSTLISASLRREPARTSKNTPREVNVSGQFYFQLPPKGKPSGVLLRFHRRPPNPAPEPFVIRDLPVPGRS